MSPVVVPTDPPTFASLDDLALAMGMVNAAAFSELQAAQGSLLLELASGLITDAVGRDAEWAAALTVVPTVLRVVCLEAAKRVMYNPSGARSESEQLGQHQHSISFTDDAHHCALTPGEERMCRLAVHGTLRASARAETLADDIADWRVAGEITA